MLIGILAFTSFGTISFTLRSETSHVASSPRHSALPTRDQLSEVLMNRNSPDRAVSPLNLASGRRSDILVLMTVIVFLHLAMSMAQDPSVSTAGAGNFEAITENRPE
jgi:hypothetical protein